MQKIHRINFTPQIPYGKKVFMLTVKKKYALFQVNFFKLCRKIHVVQVKWLKYILKCTPICHILTPPMLFSKKKNFNNKIFSDSAAFSILFNKLEIQSFYILVCLMCKTVFKINYNYAYYCVGLKINLKLMYRK